ncbi:MAG: hypothetical protein KGM42_19295 [Hyphomicrobiales bacterium]|nr:hypothetical protein [Hyphomicrobiales bacterium]
MLRHIAVCLLSFAFAGTAAAQSASPSAKTVPQLPPLPPLAPASSMVRDNCLLSAIASEDVYKDANGIQFRCFGPAAEAWFNQLPGGKEVQDPNGVFIARYFDGPGYCAHQTKAADGAATSLYLCAVDRPPLK